MRHDASIPQALHAETRAAVKDALGAFWSSVFADQELVDASLSSRVLSACQLYIDVMEALSLRDHSGLPVFHREHWHPLLIRLSEKNTGCGLTVGMRDTPQVGPQTEADSVYLPDEVFTVGGNAEYSKVNTYPFVSFDGCRLVGVKTCLCDAISAPEHVLLQGRDFELSDDVLVIRKEQDPFTSGGYRIVEDGADRIAVLWACDALFDTNNVSDFLAYPLGFKVPSTQQNARMLSALWDVLVYGVTPRYLNTLLGSVFGIQTLPDDTVVESVTDDAVNSTVVTADAVYVLPKALRSSAVVTGAALTAGTFLTNEITVRQGLSPDEVSELVTRGDLCSLSLPPGSVAGVDEAVVLENRSSTLETGGWFKLNGCDHADSPFWEAVFSRTTEPEREALFGKLSEDGTHVNPVRALGYSVLANTILVHVSCSLLADPCAGQVLSAFRRLVPAAASLLIIQTIEDADGVVLADDSVSSVSRKAIDSRLTAADDTVAYTFVPCAETEV